MPDTLTLLPSTTNYSVSNYNYMRGNTDAGLMLVTENVRSASFNLVLVWKLTGDEHAQLMSFYNDNCVNGALPFLLDLIIESEDLATYVVQWTTPPKIQNQGESFTVIARVIAVYHPPSIL